MHVLVGIPTHKRPELLRACLDSVEAQTGVSDVQVFVADNDPNGREGFNLVQSLDYKWSISAEVVEERGISAVRNAILMKAARSGVDFIGMIDDDEIAAPTWLSELVAAQALYGADIVSGPSHPVFERTPSPQIAQFFRARDLESGPVGIVYGTNNVLISTRAMYENDWPRFHPDFGLTGGGDYEWFMRLRNRGLWFAWSREAAAYEYIPASRSTARWTLARSYRYGVDRARVGRLHARGELARNVARSLVALATSPALLILSLVPRYRLKALWRLAWAAGVAGGLFGLMRREYAVRH